MHTIKKIKIFYLYTNGAYWCQQLNYKSNGLDSNSVTPHPADQCPKNVTRYHVPPPTIHNRITLQLGEETALPEEERTHTPRQKKDYKELWRFNN